MADINMERKEIQIVINTTKRPAKKQEWTVDYALARTKALEWLKDRYLLAQPVNRRIDPAPMEHQKGLRTRGIQGVPVRG